MSDRNDKTKYSVESGEDIKRGSRPSVKTYVEKPLFQVGDSVYLLTPDGNREGPYLVATAPTAGHRKCALSYSDGTPFRDNAGINVDDLEGTQ
ncbi:hypothetical protein FSARC_6159 [Fusarium sarcochroum]|uniref:Uncharacterized protein n=1 Tax=Fusarium sarcochroum TaxID=1208366 RepID=A0A8H4X8R0_9HYPO|nr:hypothetical protein FSARC_6159 [Fusarium sarcochroum]